MCKKGGNHKFLHVHSAKNKINPTKNTWIPKYKFKLRDVFDIYSVCFLKHSPNHLHFCKFSSSSCFLSFSAFSYECKHSRQQCSIVTIACSFCSINTVCPFRRTKSIAGMFRSLLPFAVVHSLDFEHILNIFILLQINHLFSVMKNGYKKKPSPNIKRRAEDQMNELEIHMVQWTRFTEYFSMLQR